MFINYLSKKFAFCIAIRSLDLVHTLEVIFKFSLAPGALPVMLAKLSTCNHPLRPYLPNCTECTRYLSSTGRFVNILLGPTKYEEFVMRDNLSLFLP